MTILDMSISGAVIILVIVVIRALTINHLPKKTFLFLWGIALCSLLIPFRMPSPLSVYNLLQRGAEAPPIQAGKAAAPFVQPMTPLQSATTVPDFAAIPVNIPVLVWLLGMLLLTAYFATTYILCRRAFRMTIPVQNEYVTNWLAHQKIKRTTEIRQSSRISAPLTYGIWRPVILMPKHTNWENTGQLDYILAHELIHIKRFDTATKLVLAAVLCIHWFNPLVWLMYLLSNRDIELSCDETVLRSFGAITKSAYARTLISMEENKSRWAPLYNHFGKNGIEERITAIMKMKKTTMAAALIAFGLIIGVAIAFATSAAAPDKILTSIPNTKFSQKDYDQLLALRFEGYQKMTVAEYQKKVRAMTDTNEYIALLERFRQDKQLYDMRDTNAAASFLFYTLIPLTSENWRTRDFSSYTQAPNDAVQGDRAVLEYQLSLTILNEKRLTVGEYEQARKGIMDSLQRFLQGKSNAELQDESEMDAAIRAEIATLKSKWENTFMKINVEYTYLPLSLYENPSNYIPNSYEQEDRPYPHASKADYQSLLALRTANYQNQSVRTFNNALLEWANEDYERNERINVDRAWNDFEVALTDKERNFITLTAWASGEENAKLVQSYYTGKEKEDPILGDFDLTKEVNDNRRTAWANLSYRLTYHISDESKLTVGERDRALAGVINGIQQYWDSMDMDQLLAMSADNILKEVNKIAVTYSSQFIEISFTNNSVHFESMAEPKIQD